MASCCVCLDRVFIAESLKYNDKVYHQKCFRCKQCGVSLRLNTARSFNKEPYCNIHSPETNRSVAAKQEEIITSSVIQKPTDQLSACSEVRQDSRNKATTELPSKDNDRSFLLATGYDAYQVQVEVAAQSFTADPITQQKIFDMFSEFNIIVCGSARVGKSTLINALCGRQLTSANPGLDACTKIISRFVLREQVKVNGNWLTYTYNFWDTPGFESWNENDIRRNFSNIISKPTSEPLCMIYCASPSCFADTRQIEWILDFCIQERKILCALVLTNKWAGNKAQRLAVMQKFKELLSKYQTLTEENENGTSYFGDTALCAMVNAQEYVDEDREVNYPVEGIDDLIEGIMHCLNDESKVFHWCRAAIQRKGLINNAIEKVKARVVDVKEFLLNIFTGKKKSK